MDLIRLYRERLRSSPEFRELQEAFGGQVLWMMQARDDLFRQLHVDTATWGLALFEKAYGLPASLSLSDQDRRARIKGKMQGVGITTIDSICRIASEYTDGEVGVLEFNQDYRFEIWLKQLDVIPPIDAIRTSVEELKPAHLSFSLRLGIRESEAGLAVLSAPLVGCALMVEPYTAPKLEGTAILAAEIYPGYGLNVLIQPGSKEETKCLI